MIFVVNDCVLLSKSTPNVQINSWSQGGGPMICNSHTVRQTPPQADIIRLHRYVKLTANLRANLLKKNTKPKPDGLIFFSFFFYFFENYLKFTTKLEF